MSTTPATPRFVDLLQFAATQRRYAAELARATGEHFNVFKIIYSKASYLMESLFH